jgi:hypothetical protein
MKKKSPEKTFSVQFATQKLREEELEEDLGGSATSAGEAYLPGLDVPKKKYVGPYQKKIKKEVKDVEPKLAAGKAKNYVKDTWGWKDAPKIPNRPSKGGFIYKDLWNENSLNESYSSFKKQTKIRDESQQFNEAIKLVRKKIDEVNKILEYSKRLKEEFPYQNSGMYEAKSHTKKSIEKLKTKIAEAYKQIKKLS